MASRYLRVVGQQSAGWDVVISFYLSLVDVRGSQATLGESSCIHLRPAANHCFTALTPQATSSDSRALMHLSPLAHFVLVDLVLFEVRAASLGTA